MFPAEREGTGFGKPAYIYNKFRVGNRWQVYIPVMTYDLLYSSIYFERSSNINKQRTLLDVTSSLPKVIENRHPCRNTTVVITGARWKGQLYFHLTYSTNDFLDDFRICGFFHITYIPGCDKEVTAPLYHSAEKPLILSWHLRSSGFFAINLTLSELVAPNSYGCHDASLKYKAHFAETLCPNWGSITDINTGFEVELSLSYHREGGNNKKDKYVTVFSFHYQILDDINISFKYLREDVHQALPQKENTLRVHNDTFLKLENAPLAFIGELPNALVYLFVLQAADHFQTYLTPVVFRKNVACNDQEAEIIFYDGEPIMWYYPRHFQPALVVWRCTGSSDEEVRGSFYFLSIIVSVPQVSFYLEITWQAKRILSSVLRQRRIELGLATISTIHLIPRNGDAFEVIDIVAPRGKSVQISFSDIDIHLITQKSTNCNNGIFLLGGLHVYQLHGEICTNSTAESILKHYKKNGLTFEHHVIISLAQHWWVARISAVITASVSHCSGYVNLIPHTKDLFITKRFLAGSVHFQYTSVFAQFYSNGNWTPDGINIRFKRSHASCARIQLVPFHTFMYSIVSWGKQGSHGQFLHYIITSQDLTSPSHFMIDSSSLGDEIQFRNISSLHTLRLSSVANTFTEVKPLKPGVWNAEAYTAEISLHISLLAHAAGLVVQAEDGKTPPICTTERLQEVAVLPDMHISGPCSHAEFHMKDSLNVIIYRPYHNRYCCRLEGKIVHTQSSHGLLLFAALYNRRISQEDKDLWEISGNTINIKLNVLCKQDCIGIVFSIYTNRNSTHETTLSYRASLFQKSDIYESFKRYQGWGKVCLKHTCYMTPESHNITTWNDANEECRQKNASLLTINSDSEESMINDFFPRDFVYRLTFIGLKIKVSKENHDYMKQNSSAKLYSSLYSAT